MRRVLYQYIRNFSAHKLNFVITLFGFSLSMAVVAILVFFILAEKSYDKAYKNIDNINMAITNDDEFYVEEDAKDIVIDQYPQIESACRYNSTRAILVSHNNFFEGRAAVVILNSDFFRWVLLSCIITCPVGYYVITNWLNNFAYKAELSWWIFAVAGGITLLIALITVSWQSWRAANRNPVEALRYE